jgi:hypothetical protein
MMATHVYLQDSLWRRLIELPLERPSTRRFIVEQTGTAETNAKHPRFLAGERRCPPEDCGGPPGYLDFIENLARKNSKKAKEALDWYGGPYDPGDMDEEQIKIIPGRIANANRTGRSKAAER